MFLIIQFIMCVFALAKHETGITAVLSSALIKRQKTTIIWPVLKFINRVGGWVEPQRAKKQHWHLISRVLSFTFIAHPGHVFNIIILLLIFRSFFTGASFLQHFLQGIDHFTQSIRTQCRKPFTFLCFSLNLTKLLSFYLPKRKVKETRPRKWLK